MDLIPGIKWLFNNNYITVIIVLLVFYRLWRNKTFSLHFRSEEVWQLKILT
jgi:hypothetical protein